MDSTHDQVPAFSAPLADPLYYLRNFHRLLAWVATRYDDLLSDTERAFVAAFGRLPEASQGLLVRLVMRRGTLFRRNRISYPELGDTGQALGPLLALGWLEADPEVDAETLAPLITRAELLRLLGDETAAHSRQSRKPVLVAALAAQRPGARPFSDWCTDDTSPIDDQLLALTIMPVCQRLRLMFFGNLYQDWSTFVLTELGHQRFEPVPLARDSRAFTCREDIDTALALHACREALEAGMAPGDVAALMPPAPTLPWLRARHDRLRYLLGRHFERAEDNDAALACYRHSALPDAAIRRIRVHERSGDAHTALALAREIEAQPPSDEATLQVRRMLPRLLRKAGQPRPSPGAQSSIQAEPAIPAMALTLDKMGPGSRVELAVQAHLEATQPGGTVHYLENALFSSLFGLLCWPAVFAPLPGAFFHPFQSGPADLRHSDFTPRRQALFDACLAPLAADQHRDIILERYHSHQGTQSPFVYWGALTEALLEEALACIPAAHLQLIFRRMLASPERHRSGFPDLVRFFSESAHDAHGLPRYELIEVKGPGDRLQDHQQRWLTFFVRHGIPASVCHVTFTPGCAPS
ncbi:MAG: VRR-NUC domain-containing protein [Alcanivorax sp.]|nr:VRR-NUC domain-containing protein [Alcanivorax sp.]